MVTHLILIELSAVFDTVDHETLCNMMEESFGVASNALEWITSYLNHHSQRVTIRTSTSDAFALDQGVPLGSCLGPVMFTQHCSPIFSATNVHGKVGHGYADDHQAYSGCDPVYIASETVSIEPYVRDIKSWMRNMKLKVNDSKTEYILIGIPHQLAKCSQSPITIGDSVIPPSNHVRNPGPTLTSICLWSDTSRSNAFTILYNISKMRK